MNLDQIGRMLQRLEARLERVENAQRLSHASLDNTALEVRDSSGGLRGLLGVQGDGTVAVNVVNGPTPPAPSAPAVAPALAALEITWDGTFADTVAAPLDWQRVEVHVGPDPAFAPDQGTLRGTIESPQGGTVTVPLPYTEWYVRLRSRTTSGVASAATDPVAATPRKADTQDLTAGAVTADTIAVDALTGKTITGGVVTGSTLQTSASGQRVVVTPANSFGLPAVQLYSGQTVETAPGEIVARVRGTTRPRPYAAVWAPTIATATDTSAYLQLFSGGGTKNDQGEFDLSTGYGSGGVTRIYGYASDGAANGGEIVHSVYEPVTGAHSTVTHTQYMWEYLDSSNRGFGLFQGVFFAPNVAWGSVLITPIAANQPASVTVSGLNIAGSKFHAYTTANSGVPGTTMLGTSANNVSSSGLTVWLTRTGTTSTTVWWMVIGS